MFSSKRKVETHFKEKVTEIADLKETIDLLHDKINELTGDKRDREQRVQQLKMEVESKIDDQEQYSRHSCLLFQGIPEVQDSEDTNTLVKMSVKTCWEFR